MIGPKKLPEWLRRAYLRAVNYTCEDCLLEEGTKRKDGSIVKLEVHRITQGYKGGTYLPRNCKVDCDKCHDKYDEKW
jgi:hypothetical protein